jgi:hypothetical protein
VRGQFRTRAKVRPLLTRERWPLEITVNRRSVLLSKPTDPAPCLTMVISHLAKLSCSTISKADIKRWNLITSAYLLNRENFYMRSETRWSPLLIYAQKFQYNYGPSRKIRMKHLNDALHSNLVVLHASQVLNSMNLTFSDLCCPCIGYYTACHWP